MKYRKLPVVVDAMQFTDESKDLVLHWAQEQYMAIWAAHEDAIPVMRIQTLEGTMTAHFGDWIIKGINGEIYPCKPDIFAKTYEPVDEGECKK